MLTRGRRLQARGVGEEEDVVVFIALAHRLDTVSIVDDDHQAVLRHPVCRELVVEWGGGLTRLNRRACLLYTSPSPRD